MLFGNALTAAQRLSKAVIAIMGDPRYTALAQVMMVGNRTIGSVQTAATNGRDEVYGKEFIESLSDSELRFLVLHETRHKLYRHLHIWRHLYDENKRLANMACDYVINLQIIDENKDGFATMPMRKGKPVGLFDEKFRGMDTAMVYKILKQESEGSEGNGKSDGEGDGAGLDDHDWAGAEEMSTEDIKELEREIDEAIRQGALTAGKLGHTVSRDIEKLLEPQIDWREALRQYVTDTCAGKDYGTWRKPNRRYVAAGVYMPSTISEQIGELVIAIDTSGSIGGPQLTQFLSEVGGVAEMAKPKAIRLLYWDTEVRADERYELEDIYRIADSTKPKGGGGTSMGCVTRYMSDNNITAQAVIVLTDGYVGSDWGDGWSVPVLYCIQNNPSASAPGQTLHINL